MSLSDIFSRLLAVTGVMFLGVAAGVRYSLDQTKHHLACTPDAPFNAATCDALYAQLGTDTTTFLVGGLMILASGAFVQYALQKRTATQTDADVDETSIDVRDESS